MLAPLLLPNSKLGIYSKYQEDLETSPPQTLTDKNETENGVL